MSQEAAISKWNLPRKILLAALAVSFLFLCFWNLSYSPATWFDEGINLGVAKSLVKQGVYSLPVAPGQFVQERSYLITTNFPVLIPVATSIWLFGNNFFAARLPMVLYLLLFMAAAFLLARKLYGGDYALLGIALLISFVPLYGDGKAVLGEVPGLFYLLSALILLLDEDFKAKRLFFTGVLLGLAVASKPFFLIILPAFFIGELYSYFQTKKISWRRLLWLSVGLALPLWIWFLTLLTSFSWSGVMAMIKYYSNSYAANDLSHQVVANLLRFISERTPLHFFLLFLAVAVGLFFRIKKGSRLREVEVILFSFILINILWYLKTPGWYRYFFIAHLLLLLFMPAFFGYFGNKKTVVAIVIILFSLQFVYLVSKRYDKLYLSGSVQLIVQQVERLVTPQDKILIISSPSVSFLLNNYQVYQFLQINPVLFFGNNSLKDEENNFFPFIITNASVKDLSIVGVEEILQSQYKVVGWNYQHTLYKKK